MTLRAREDEMTRYEWDEIVRGLMNEIVEAHEANDRDRVIGTEMALSAFIEVVRLPPEETSVESAC
jgi:hypothetical protein